MFVLCIGISLMIGLIQSWQSGGYLQLIIAPSSPPQVNTSLSIWLLLAAFANGLTAMTGVEAVSNAVPLFRKPTVKNAQKTLTIIVVILGLFLLLIGYLCPVYHIVAMDESKFKIIKL
jgi:amino acid transporter